MYINWYETWPWWHIYFRIYFTPPLPVSSWLMDFPLLPNLLTWSHFSAVPLSYPTSLCSAHKIFLPNLCTIQKPTFKVFHRLFNLGTSGRDLQCQKPIKILNSTQLCHMILCWVLVFCTIAYIYIMCVLSSTVSSLCVVLCVNCVRYGDISCPQYWEDCICARTSNMPFSTISGHRVTMCTPWDLYPWVTNRDL